MPQFNNDFDIETVNENSAPLDDSLMENAGANDDKKVADGKSDDKLPSAELILANGISNARLAKSTIIRNSFYGVIMELSFRHYSNKQTLKLIFEITSMWTVQRKRFPSPFSWLNSKNQSHCQWLWDEMHKRCVGIPFHAKDQTQQWCFIIATFDNWKGWTLAQEEYLQEKNPKRKPGKFLSSGLDPSEREIEHKKLLLDELKKAWDQKERRAKKAKEPAAVRLTKADQKKLQFISGIEGTTSKDILSEMIDNAYNDAKRKARQL